MSEPGSERQRAVGSVATLAAVLIGGVVLRAWHLGTFSLWWDEIVHVWTAQRATLADVVQQAKQGIPPGSGNAGAVPLDYVLLHLFLRVFPALPPEWLEVRYRLPALAYSCLTLPLLYALGRRFLDRDVALLSTLLLATSIPHLLYAAEARFYALFILTTVLNLYAFAWLVERRDAPRRWGAYAVVALVYFLSGLFSLFVLAAQYAVLAVLVAAPFVRRRAAVAGDVPEAAGARDVPDPAAARRALAGFLVTSVLLAAAVAAYFADTDLGHKYRRDPRRIPDTLQITWNTLYGLSSDNLLLVAALLLLPVALVWAWRRGSVRRALVTSLALSLLAIPIIVELARWKRYYFHPRHALFLLPGIETLTAIALLALLGALDPLRRLRLVRSELPWRHVALACLLVVATQLPTLRSYLAHPERFFARSKKTYDLRGLTQTVRDATRDYAERDKYLLVLQRNVMANATLAQYLRWYGLGDRVVLRGTDDPSSLLGRACTTCETTCFGHRGGFVDRSLGLTQPYGLSRDFLLLLDLVKPVGGWPGIVRDLGVVAWGPLPASCATDRYQKRALRGLSLVELVPPAQTAVAATPPRAPAAAPPQGATPASSAPASAPR